MRKLKKMMAGISALSLCLTMALQPMTLSAEGNASVNVSISGGNASVSVNGGNSCVIINGEEVTSTDTTVTTEEIPEVTEESEVLGEQEVDLYELEEDYFVYEVTETDESDALSEYGIWGDEPENQLFNELNTRAATDTNNYSPSAIGVTCTYRVGDCNGDGKINNTDLLALKSYVGAPIKKVYISAMDINKDGVINSTDTALLKTKLSNGKSVSSVKICLDAGHYGNNYNASTVPGYTTSYYESAMTWKLHKYLAEELQSYGFQVVVTRNSQSDKALTSRGQSAAGCDLFISLHSNAIANDYKTSYDQYNNSIAICNYYATSNTSRKAMCDVSNAVGKALANASSDTIGLHGKIDSACAKLSTGSQADGYVMHRTGNYSSTYGNSEYYGVLRGARSVGVPGILLENSYHTSKTGTAWLSNDDNLKKLAKAEAKALAEYYGWYK